MKIGSAALFLCASFLVGWGGVLLGGCGSSDSSNKPAPDPTSREAARAEKGLIAVQNRKCQQCHGDDMAGATKPIAQPEATVELYPPNLTNSEQGIKNWTDDQLATAIRTGYDDEGLQLCPQMKHDSKMSDYEVFSIVLYLRSLPPKPNVIPRSVCPPLKLKSEQNQ